MLTNRDLNEIGARERKATPGPWTCGDDGRSIWPPAGELVVCRYTGLKEPADGAFIAASRTDVPALLDLVERMLPFVRAMAQEGCVDSLYSEHIDEVMANPAYCPRCAARAFLREFDGEAE